MALIFDVRLELQGPILPVPYLDFTVSTAVRNLTKCRDFETTAL